MATAPSAARVDHAPAQARLLLIVVVAAVAVGWCSWTVRSVAGAHETVAQRNWVLVHARRHAYRVEELGLQRRDGRALAAWISVPDGRQAFVDLHDSAQRVTGRGQMLQARVDGRAGYAGIAVAEDTLRESVVRRYLDAVVWPGLAAVLLVGVGAVIRFVVVQPRSGIGACSAVTVLGEVVDQGGRPR